MRCLSIASFRFGESWHERKSETISKITFVLAKDYVKTLLELKKQIRKVQIKAVSVNKEPIKLYFMSR